MWYAILLLGAQHFFTQGAAVDQILRVTLLSIGICPRTQCEGEAMQNSTCKESFNISLTPLRTSKQASNKQTMAPRRVSSLYRRYSKDYKKLLNIEKHHRKAYLEKEMRGAAATCTPCLKREDTLHAYWVATNMTDSCLTPSFPHPPVCACF